MGAVADLVEDVTGGVVEAFGDVVESVVDVVEDVGSAIDDYVIQPILDDPLTAIATVAAAAYLGPAAATMFGTSASVGVGIAAGAANAAAGLVQGESFDEAIKGGAMAGLGAGVGAELFGPTTTPSPTDPLDDFLAANNNFIDTPMDSLASAPSAVSSPVDFTAPAPTDTLDDFLAANNNFVETPAPVVPEIPAPSPLQTQATVEIPEIAPSPLQTATAPTVEIPEIAPVAPPAATVPAPTDALDDFLAANNNFVDVPVDSFAAPDYSLNSPAAPDYSLNSPAAPDYSLNSPAAPDYSLNSGTQSALDSTFQPDYSLSSGTQSGAPGLKVPEFTPADSFNMYGEPNYSLVPEGISGGPGLQLPDSPNLASMGGGQGLTARIDGLPQYMENGVPTTFQGANGQTYGNPTPEATISSRGVTPLPETITYDATTNMGAPSVLDQVASGNIGDAAKNIGNKAIEWYKGASPWEVGAVGLGAATLLGGAGGPPPSQPPPKAGSTQDKNFNKSLDLYKYMRDKTNYGGDLAKYGQAGGEHQFFKNTQFVPVPIPAKMGGLIQMKHFAQGGMAQGMQDPRRAQMMAAMAQQRPAGQGGPMGMAQGRPQMPQQGMQQRPQMQRPQMQRPRDPKTAYYQYGNAPVQAKAMGGLSQVNSMKIGGGADGRSDDVNAVLSDGEYVMDAETVAMLGNGSSKAGAAKLDQMRSALRQHKGKNLAGGKISPDAKSPLAYLKGA